MITAAGEELCWRLSSASALARLGFEAELDDHRTVVVSRRGHVVGIWRSQAGMLNWFPAANAEPTMQCATVVDAVKFTIAAIEARFDRAD